MVRWLLHRHDAARVSNHLWTVSSFFTLMTMRYYLVVNRKKNTSITESVKTSTVLRECQRVTNIESSLHWGTVAAELKAPFAENPELSKVLSSKPDVGQNIAMHASPTARNFSLFNF